MVFDFFRAKKRSADEVAEPAPVQSQEGESTLSTVQRLQPADSAPDAEHNKPEAAEPTRIVEATAVAEIAPSELSRVVPPSAAEPQTPPLADEPKVDGQLETINATREDVIAAYKIFLGRQPESMEVVDPRVGVTPMELLIDFLVSKEFLDQPVKSQLILAVAKKILDARQAEGGAQQAQTQSSNPTAE